MGVFTQYQQASRFVEGSMIYNNIEFYIQDNWKVNNRLTLDYGMRFTHQQPQHDQYPADVELLPGRSGRLAQAPQLYVAGCSGGDRPCTGNIRSDGPGQRRDADGPAGQHVVAIGTPIPNTGNPPNGIRQAGDGISKYNYVWPTLVFGPRFGVAYDLTGNQSFMLRGGDGLFYDRPDGNTVFSIPGNPPITTSAGPAQRHVASSRPGACARIGVPDARHVPVRREGADVVAVEHRRADVAPVVVVARRVLRRQPRLRLGGLQGGRRST